MEACDAVLRELDSARSKLTTFQENFNSGVDYLMTNVAEMQSICENSDRDLTDEELAALEKMVQDVKENMSSVMKQHRDVHCSVSKIGKAIDKNFYAMYTDFAGDTEKLAKDEKNRRGSILTNSIVKHLYNEGQLEIAETLSRESGSELNPKIVEPYIELYRILNALKNHVLQPALEFYLEHKVDLDSRASNLGFQLQRLVFIDLLKKKGHVDPEVLQHVRKELSPFAVRYEKEFQILMRCLMYTTGRVDGSPYAHLFGQTLWDEVYQTFRKDVSTYFGISLKSPLAVAVEVGCVTLPALINLAKTLKASDFCLVMTGEFELPIKLGSKFRFHSVFSCPILRDMCTATNPPMRLTCGHVICLEAMKKIAANKSKMKCPYCPKQMDPKDAKQITF